MKIGHGSRLTFGNFTLFVEARKEGWIAGIRDHSLIAWHWQEHVAGEKEGRSLAMTKLLAHITAEQRLALAADDPQWEPY
ncbi:MAG TPA: hypothetical protein VNH18_23155 [Bryobacteraceae bacterium]|jgi:hypothetical protein|nr:hypothetical protein [Bryobacteraceae bacterium]HXJ42196.1 hypothetical protein [Bryobacteraceae bacterium]